MLCAECVFERLECFIPDLMDGDARFSIEVYLDFAALGEHVPRGRACGAPPNVANCGNGRRDGSNDLGP